MRIARVSYTESFKQDLDRAPVDVRSAALDAIGRLVENPRAKSLRVHTLNGYRPTIFKFDVFPNRSWQISFELVGEDCTLRRLRTHRAMDRDPR